MFAVLYQFALFERILHRVYYTHPLIRASLLNFPETKQSIPYPVYNDAVPCDYRASVMSLLFIEALRDLKHLAAFTLHVQRPSTYPLYLGGDHWWGSCTLGGDQPCAVLTRRANLNGLSADVFGQPEQEALF